MLFEEDCEGRVSIDATVMLQETICVLEEREAEGQDLTLTLGWPYTGSGGSWDCSWLCIEGLSLS